MALSNEFRNAPSSINIGHRMKYKDFIALTKPSSTDKSHTGEARRRGNDDNQEIIASQEGSEPHENLTKPVPVSVNNIRHAMKPKVDTVDDSIKTVEHFSDLSKTIDIVDDSRKPDDNVNALTKMVDEVNDSTKLFENADDLTDAVDNVIELTKMTENVENSRITDGCFNVSHKKADTVMETDITNLGINMQK